MLCVVCYLQGLKTTEEKEVDSSMIPVRASVEDSFGYMAGTFPYFRNMPGDFFQTKESGKIRWNFAPPAARRDHHER